MSQFSGAGPKTDPAGTIVGRAPSRAEARRDRIPQPWLSSLLGSDRRGGADAFVDVAFELREVLDELAHELLGGAVVLLGVRPGRARIEEPAVDPRNRDRVLEAEVRVLAEFGVVQVPSSAALSSARVALIGMRFMPSIVALPPDQPVLTNQQVTPPLAMRSLSKLP